jgi:UDP-N-acetylglucosamine--N-acetylmuramyl-(pentapeptide) pyrophosphoryl-undecaprenol N-acetylglucosamine transferase
MVRERYLAVGIKDASVIAFIDEMPKAIAWADLVLSRSGASAVSEICAVGRPSLLVPYPFAAGNHQQINAETLAAAGAARWLRNSDASAERIAKEAAAMLQDDSLLSAMAKSAVDYGRPRAAQHIATDLLNLAGGRVPPSIQACIAARTKEIG